MRDEPKMDAKRLITEVHKRPALWNQRHISYHNRDVTNRIWMEIATLFKLPKQVLKTKWKGLRDTFRAEIKKEQVYRKSKYTPNRPAWIHFKTLQFLKEQMLPRPPIWERNANARDDASSGAAASEDSCAGTDASESIGDVAALLNPKTRREIPITAAGAAANASATATFVANPRTKEQRRASSRIGATTNLHLKLLTRRNSPAAQKSLLRKSCAADALSVVSVKEDLGAAANATQHRPNILSFKSSNNNTSNNNNVSSYNGTDNVTGNNASNSSNNNNSSKNQIVISCPVKLEPHDNYEENVDEFGNMAEEMSNLVDEGSMLGSMSTEEVLMAAESAAAAAAAAAENCPIAAGQHAVDPLEGNRFDDNYYFFMSLLPHIRSLPAERRMLLRMQMQQLVYQEVYDKSRATLHQDQRARSPC